MASSTQRSLGWYGRPLIILLICGVVIALFLSLRVNRYERAASLFFEELTARSEQLDLAVVTSGETLIGATAADDHVVAVRLGDALTRWQVAKTAGVPAHELVDIGEQVTAWLQRTDVRGAGAEFARALVESSYQGELDARALRSLRRSLPDGKVEAGRWLAALRLWPPGDGDPLTAEQRKTIFAVLDAADLMRAAPPRLAELLSQKTLSLPEASELRDLATQLTLATSH